MHSEWYWEAASCTTWSITGSILLIIYCYIVPCLVFVFVRMKTCPWKVTRNWFRNRRLYVIYNKITLLLFIRKLLVVSVWQRLLQTFIVAACLDSWWDVLLAYLHIIIHLQVLFTVSVISKKLLLLSTVARISCIRVLMCCHTWPVKLF